MSYNILNNNGNITTSNKCLFDSNIGYEADFSVNGDVSGWDYYSGIHTYGCWNNFLFATLYNNQPVIGRSTVFSALSSEYFYTIRLVMKIKLVERVGSQIVPTKGKIAWRTLSSPLWESTKEHEFDINTDNEWTTYRLNLGEESQWQGDINDLRIYPIINDGRDGDEFYIRAIEIISSGNYYCLNSSCDYFNNYTNNCGGIGERGYCISAPLASFVSQGSTFEFAAEKKYTIEENINDTLVVNINNYGDSIVKLPAVNNYTGQQLAKLIAKEISKINVGGYAECYVEYTSTGEFKIYSGIYANDSTVVIKYSQLAEDLNFFNSSSVDLSTKYVGSYPASGFKPLSSFRISTNQLYLLLDDNEDSDINFNPFLYNVEGGRNDWLEATIGDPAKDIRGSSDDELGVLNRFYSYIDNSGKTLIDFNHPFNASGRITKIFAGITLDNFISADSQARGSLDTNRINNQLSGAKIMFFRPRKDGSLQVLSTEIDIPNREHTSGNLYSAIQEHIEIDCDVFVNKGDLIGVYNANVYKGKSVTGQEIDALYYQVSGKASGILQVRQPSGYGSAGLLLYARSDQRQNRLLLNIDLGKRLNVNNLIFKVDAEEQTLEYNIARCLDIDWEVDLFGEDYTTGYVVSYRPLVKAYYNHPNLYYGKNCLSDGIKVVADGLAADSFSVQYGTSYTTHAGAIHKQDGGKAVIPVNAKYFHVNGDCEWLDVYELYSQNGPFAVGDFENDPIAFTLKFPYEKEKIISRSKIYFKERYNFRSFELSIYKGDGYALGNADDVDFDYIPNRDDFDTPWTKITLDGLEYTPEDEYRWADIDLYLSQNPCIGHIIEERVGTASISYDSTLDLSYFDELGGMNYYASYRITNNDQYTQATSVDWNIIEHEWPPIAAKGFRFYCNNHYSTKITEFELYCTVDDEVSAITGAIDIDYSDYGDFWTASNNEVVSGDVVSYIGDTPRYIDINIRPIVETNLKDLSMDVSYGDVYMGNKGCDYLLLPDDTKKGIDNPPKKVYFKNVYGYPYNLYVDISSPTDLDKGIVFYSLMNNSDSITNPLIGPSAYYKKSSDFPLVNYQKNVAINCPVYALKSVLANAQVWYSYDDETSWKYYGSVTNGKNINFSNLPNTVVTTVNLPVLNRAKWWKIGFFDDRVVTNVYEVHVYYEDEEIEDVVFYHNKGQDPYSTPNDDTAPHLQDSIIDGSYYEFGNGSYIGFELPGIQSVDKIVLYLDTLLEYENSYDKAGIDSSTALYIPGSQVFVGDSILDISYYEHEITTIGSGIYYDHTSYVDTYYDFIEDFSNCIDFVQTFSSPDIDLSVWTDLVNASIVDEKLNVTNSGTIGQVITVDYTYNDFEVTVDLDIDNGYVGLGWGCYLSAFTDTNNRVSVGKTYIDGVNKFVGKSYSGVGWLDLGYKNSNDLNNLKLKIKRDGDTTDCYVWDSNDTWYSVGTTNVLGASPVKFGLYSDLTPFAEGTTIAKYDNFVIDNSAADWGTIASYGSFTCVSGVGPNDWANYYYVYANLGYTINDMTYKKVRVFDQFNNNPIDESFVFTFDFTFKAEKFYGYYSYIQSRIGPSVGIIEDRSPWVEEYDNIVPFVGASILINYSKVQIFICNYEGQIARAVSSSLNTEDQFYYCRFTSDGAGHYHCYIWTDDFSGSNLIIDFGLTTTIRWSAGKVGFGLGTTTNDLGYASGWISDFDFSCYKRSFPSTSINTGSLRFNAYQDEKLLIEYDTASNCSIEKDGLNFKDKYFTIDFFIKFNSFPTDENPQAIIMSSWDENQPIVHGQSVIYPSSWVLVLEKVSTSYRWRFYVNYSNVCRRVMDYTEAPDLYRLYHIYIGRGPSGYAVTYINLLINGYQLYYNNTSYLSNIVESEKDIIIGKNFDGWLGNIRISCDYTTGGRRIGFDSSSTTRSLIKNIPIEEYKKYYTFSVFNSIDNIYYGKNYDVDTLFDNSYSYHLSFSSWSYKYNTYLAIDFGQRHALDLIRSYPINTSYQFSLTSNTFYSNKDTALPSEAFSLNEQEDDVSNNFDLQDYDYPENWTKVDTLNSISYTIDGFFYQKCMPNAGPESSIAESVFYFNGDFDIYIDYVIDILVYTDSWAAGLLIEDIDNTNKAVKIQRCYSSGNKYRIYVKDDSSSWALITSTDRNHSTGSLRIERNASAFRFFIKGSETSEFELINSYSTINLFGTFTRLSIFTESTSSEYPTIGIFWDNFVMYEGLPVFGSYLDARWVKIKMLNGDGTDRILENIDIYPSITTSSLGGNYNTYWEALGSSVTTYADAENIAIGATISGSGYVGSMLYDNMVNGIIPNGDLGQCWGSTETTNPWFTIILNQVESIFKFKIYHGFEEGDTTCLINDYRIMISTDGDNFSTIFTITNNSSFSRTHDLATPVEAKYIKIYVDDYTTREHFIWIDENEGYQFWKGAVLREVEIYKYYGFTSINSESNPIIAIDLQQPYFIEGHSLIGMYTESSDRNWDNSDSNFAWSSSRLSDPSKVLFSDWGEDSSYAKWVVVKRNTATSYPNVPTTLDPNTDTPDYLKHVVINATKDEVSSPNPIEYPWMWRSNFSVLSYDYDTLIDNNNVERTLRIDYPSSTQTEHISFIEGDYFSSDENASWRDGFGFYMYIEDISTLDLSYGYFYIGGVDYTYNENPVTYRWNITTFSGILNNGWNNLNLTFLYADDVLYTEVDVDLDGRDPRRLYSINWGSVGFVFKGNATGPVRLNFGGLFIERNHFEHGCYTGQQGLYLHKHDFMKAPLSEIDLSSCTIDFWLRPDWDWDGMDIYNDFKFRSLFHFGNVANDVFGVAISNNGLEVYFGNLLNDFNIFVVSGFNFNAIDSIFHMAFVISNNGKNIDSDKSSIRIYINNQLFAVSKSIWGISDSKYFNFILGGQSLLIQKSQGFDPTASSLDAVICRLKIRNYCETDFSDSLIDMNIEESKLLKPSDLIEISDDNVTYHRVGSDSLPFLFPDVAPNDSIPVWVKVLVPKNISSSEKRTAELIGSWDIGV